MKKTLHIGFLIIIVLLLVTSFYLKITQPALGIDEFLYCLLYGVKNSDFKPVFDAVLLCLPIGFVILGILIYIFYFGKGKVLKTANKYRWLISGVMFFITLIIVLINLNAHTYLYNHFSKSNFIENNYVDPHKLKLVNKDKMNLITIFIESGEATLLDKKNGGSWDHDLMPELASILNDEDATVFKTKDSKVGMKLLDTSLFTTSSLYTNTSALPFKFNLSKRLTKNDFFKGSYTIGDYLKDEGYHNELISSARTSFGGVKELFSNHGSYNIIDVDSLAKNNLKLPKKDISSWGFNDLYLYEAAKKRLKVLSKSDKPFNMTLVGIDTHFPKGFKTYYTKSGEKSQLANVYKTESRLVSDFIKWVKKQDFYQDTVIVILGDHFSMQTSFFKKIPYNERLVYIVYLNAQVEAKKTHNRVYTSLDTYPTTLGAMGIKIPNNRISLGTNMFSNKKTLAEENNFNELNKKLLKKSNYYDTIILDID